MAPVKTTPHKSGGHQRYVPEKSKNPARFQPELEGSDDANAGALQPVKEPQEDDFEGFGTEEESEEDGAQDEDSDAESIDIQTESKREKPVLPKDAEEEELERMIFGDSEGFRQGLENFSLDPTAGAYGDSSDDSGAEAADLDNVADQDLFFFDAGPVPAPAGSVAAKVTESDEDDGKPAWEDSDDERLVVSLASVPQLRKLRETADDDMVNGKEYARRLRKQYERLYPTPDWAAHATGKANKKRRRTIDIQRLKDVAKAGPSAVTSLSFHPAYPLLLSSGPSSTLYLHHVNPNPPNPNPLLTSLHIKRTPLATTAFHPSPSDSRIFLSARRRYFHVWNIATGRVEKVSRVYGHQHEQRTMEFFSLSPNGKYMALRGSSRKGGGVVNILDARTLQWATQVRIESRGGIADFAWWGDGSGMSIAGKNGEVTEWSVQEGVVGRWNDEGAVGTTTIALGGKSGRESWLGGDRWVAIGSSSGVVNVYDRRAWSEKDPSVDSTKADSNGGIPKAPKPLRDLQNLTTPISHLAFTADGQVLAMASRWKNNAMRLVHLPSATVFKNWPTEKTPLGRITAVAWGRPTEEEEKEGSLAQLAVANEAGHIRMWEIRA